MKSLSRHCNKDNIEKEVRGIARKKFVAGFQRQNI